MPHIDIDKTPFIKKPAKNSFAYNLPKFAAIPRLNLDKNGKAMINIFLNKDFDKSFSPFPYESLRIDVYGNINQDQMEEFVHQLLNQFKWRTKQWWINRTMTSLFGYFRGGFNIDKNGYPIKEAKGTIRVRTTSGNELALNHEILITSLEAVLKKDEPVFYEMLFLDSLFYSNSRDIKLTIFHLAITCEQALEYFANQKWENQNLSKREYKKSRIFKGDNLTEHIDIYSLKYFNESYKVANPKNYELIKIMWRARNNIAHGGGIEFILNDELIKIDSDLMKSILFSVQDLTDWLAIKSKN